MMAYHQVRQEMVKYQIKHRGIHNQAILEAFLSVERHLFVSKELIPYAYDDHPLSIGHHQTISQPYIVAYMMDKLDLKATDRVLEIGTGSGYQTALLAEVVQEVYTVEIKKPLQEKAKKILNQLAYQNIHYHISDGHMGWKTYAPYNKIIVSCASKELPEILIKQLQEQGKMIIPIGSSWFQYLYLIKKEDNQINQIKLDAVRFVPMVKK
ncbi:MAG TPA: protein-L-isoaspartate(D-aspartate) O-methyltransferase [Candidatus Izemoplasmatales bacterium]|nr:protein-L-isoaspartate(D-aspartate) O-methyltransferase [Candidatus Izemoplasmatales bacterium]